MWVVTVVLLAGAALRSATEAPRQTFTSLGPLRGSTLRSRAGRDYLAFTGIPYAKPPVGTRRFLPPEPADPWIGVLDASKPPPVCYQSTHQGAVGVEDCLHLNIYTPKLNASLPVMVYIHGGGFRNGNPGPASATKYFMDEDVVLVMPNYRLGPFGFLSTEDQEIPGNMGLKDMALALEWVHENIHSFGGDRDSVTAFGISAGGAAAHYLCSALRTRGLLKSCISESGAAGSFWSLFKPGQARMNAIKVANAVGCFGDGLLPCLQQKQAQDILKTERLLKFWTGEPLIIYAPVLERSSETAFLTEWPTDSNFPWLTGVTSNEGKYKSGVLEMLFSNKSYAEEFYANKVELLSRILSLNEGQRDAAMKVYQRFFANNSFYDGMEKLYSEALFVHPVLKSLKMHKGPKYFYVFDKTGPTYVQEVFGKKPKYSSPGVSHGDSAFYYFDFALKGLEKPQDQKMSKDLVKMWVNFAKHQNPTPDGKPKWNQFRDNCYLLIEDSGFTTEKYENIQEILDFWEQIF